MEHHATAKVVECFGRRAIVQLPSKERKAAVVFGKRLEIVCGDLVRLSVAQNSDELQVVEILPRKTSFARTDTRGRTEILAANLSLVAVMFAPEPAPDLYVVDRYLAGAAYSGLRTLVV